MWRYELRAGKTNPTASPDGQCGDLPPLPRARVVRELLRVLGLGDGSRVGGRELLDAVGVEGAGQRAGGEVDELVVGVERAERQPLVGCGDRRALPPLQAQPLHDESGAGVLHQLEQHFRRAAGNADRPASPRRGSARIPEGCSARRAVRCARRRAVRRRPRAVRPRATRHPCRRCRAGWAHSHRPAPTVPGDRRVARHGSPARSTPGAGAPARGHRRPRGSARTAA